MGTIITNTPRHGQGRPASVIDGIPFSLFLLFHYRIPNARTCVCEHVHTHTVGAWPAASVRSTLAPLCTDVSKNPILLFYCASGDRSPSLRVQGHRTHQHKEPYLWLSVPLWTCVLSLSVYLPSTVSLSYTHLPQSPSYSFTLRAMSIQLLECPDPKYAEIATIASMTTKYQASQSGLDDSELLFIRLERFVHIRRFRIWIVQVFWGEGNLHHMCLYSIFRWLNATGTDCSSFFCVLAWFDAYLLAVVHKHYHVSWHLPSRICVEPFHCHVAHKSFPVS